MGTYRAKTGGVKQLGLAGKQRISDRGMDPAQHPVLGLRGIETAARKFTSATPPQIRVICAICGLTLLPVPIDLRH